MADDYVEKIDLDGEQWDLKDNPLTEQVSDLQTYSTTEINTGKKWIDDKPIYRKVIDFGVLPNARLKAVASGITNVDTVIDLRGYSSSPDYKIPLPYVSTTDSNSIILYYRVSDNAIIVQSAVDKSFYTETIIIMEYTKTTD